MKTELNINISENSIQETIDIDESISESTPNVLNINDNKIYDDLEDNIPNNKIEVIIENQIESLPEYKQTNLSYCCDQFHNCYCTILWMPALIVIIPLYGIYRLYNTIVNYI